jgi:hypothetical protein
VNKTTNFIFAAPESAVQHLTKSDFWAGGNAVSDIEILEGIKKMKKMKLIIY